MGGAVNTARVVTLLRQLADELERDRPAPPAPPKRPRMSEAEVHEIAARALRRAGIAVDE